ncbi:hypothetical protein [Halogeometricum limi]|uniref:Uncharacterized protein n=1 Tax=Halogeometricum limi TaxID=555875 RepID=A0A1I6IVC9_9EURY|nr:hypothetical protein [Halogeometricum limi]SFR70160.1 hypothetical protein SAMN04488124_3666 [Halogeometricum limi]
MTNSRLERNLRRNGWATVGLGLSVVFAVGAFAYFALAGTPLRGAVLGVLVLGAGVWEYRRKLQDTVVAERYEAEAEAQRRENRR